MTKKGTIVYHIEPFGEYNAYRVPYNEPKKALKVAVNQIIFGIGQPKDFLDVKFEESKFSYSYRFGDNQMMWANK